MILHDVFAPKGKRRSVAVNRGIQGATPPMRGLEVLLGLLEQLSAGHQLRRLTARRTVQPGLSGEIISRYYAACVLDGYILSWFNAEIVILFFGLRALSTAVIVGLSSYRLMEIAQVFGNAVLFDRRRSMRQGVREYMVLSVGRSLVQSVVLLLETALCFALVFYAGRQHLTGVHGGRDALDLSLRTITTVGSEVGVHGMFRLLVDLEPLVGLLFAGTVLARLINAMPRFADTEQNLSREHRERLEGEEVQLVEWL